MLDGEIGKAETQRWLRSSGVVLDLGCGEGRYLQFLLQKGIDLVAMEIDEQKLKAVGPLVPRIRGDASSIPIAAEALGSVLCIYVLEHLADARNCIAELRRTLREGGKLFVFIPCRKSLPEVFGKSFKTFAHSWDRKSRFMTIEQDFSYREITTLLQHNGFRIIKIVHGEFAGTHLLLRIRHYNGEKLKTAHKIASYVVKRLGLNLLLQNSAFYCVKDELDQADITLIQKK